MSEEKLTLARLKKFGQNFEVSIDPDLALKFKQGEINDVSEALKSEQVFSDARKALVVPGDELEKIFQTSDALKIAERIIKEGEIQLNSEQRNQEREQRKRKLINLISTMAVDPNAGLPHPPNRIEAALEQAHVHLDDNKPVEEQFEEIIKKLRPILPIKIEQRILTIKIQPTYVGKTNNFIRNNSKLLKEDWNSDGSWTVKVEIPAGFQQDLIEKLNAITRGEVVIDIENE